MAFKILCDQPVHVVPSEVTPSVQTSLPHPHKKLLEPSEKERLRNLFDQQVYHYSFRVEGFKDSFEFDFELLPFLKECKEFFEERGAPILDFYVKGGARGYIFGERDDDLADLDLTLEVEDQGPAQWKMIEKTYLDFLCYKAGLACGTDDGSDLIAYYCRGQFIGKIKKSQKFRDANSLFINGGLGKKFSSPNEGFSLFKLPTTRKGKSLPLDFDIAASKGGKFLRKNSCTGSDDCVCVKITPVVVEKGPHIWEKDVYAYSLDGINIHHALRDARLKLVTVDLEKVRTVHEGYRIHCKKLTEGKIYPSFFDMDKAYLEALVAEYEGKWDDFGKNLRQFLEDHYKNDRASQILYVLNSADNILRSKALEPQSVKAICIVLSDLLSDVLGVQKFPFSERDLAVYRAYLYLVYSPLQMRQRGLYDCGAGRSVYILPIKERRCLNFEFCADELCRDLKNIQEALKACPLAQGLSELFPLSGKKTLASIGAEKAESHFKKPLNVSKEQFKDASSFAKNFAHLKTISDKHLITEIQSYLWDLLKREGVATPSREKEPFQIKHQVVELLHYHASICKGKHTEALFLYLLECRGFFTLEQVRMISLCLINRVRMERGLKIYSQIALLCSDASTLLKDIIRKFVDRKKETGYVLILFKPLISAALKKDSYFVSQKELIGECVALLNKNYDHFIEGLRIFIGCSIQITSVTAPTRHIIGLFFTQYEKLPLKAKNTFYETFRKEVCSAKAFASDDSIQLWLKQNKLVQGPVERKEMPQKSHDVFVSICKKIECSIDKLSKPKKLVSIVFKDLLNECGAIAEEHTPEFHRFLLLQEERIKSVYQTSGKDSLQKTDLSKLLTSFLIFHITFARGAQDKNPGSLKTPFLDILRPLLTKADTYMRFDSITSPMQKMILIFETDVWDTVLISMLSHPISASELIHMCSEFFQQSSKSHEWEHLGEILKKIIKSSRNYILIWSNTKIRLVRTMPVYDVYVQLLGEVNNFLKAYLEIKKKEDPLYSDILKGSIHLASSLCEGELTPGIKEAVDPLLSLPSSLLKNDEGLQLRMDYFRNIFATKDEDTAYSYLSADVPQDISYEQIMERAQTELDKENLEAALGFYEAAYDKDPTPDTYLKIADVYSRLKKIHLSIFVYKRGNIKYPSNLIFIDKLAELFLEMGVEFLKDPLPNRKEAIKFLEDAVAHFTRLLPSQNYPHAKNRLRRTYSLLYQLTHEVKYRKLAYEHFKERLAADPKDALALSILGEIAISFNDSSSALTYFQKAAIEEPTPERYEILFQLKSRTLSLSEQISFLSDAISRVSSPATQLLYLRSLCHKQMGNIDAAEKDLDIVLKYSKSGSEKESKHGAKVEKPQELLVDKRDDLSLSQAVELGEAEMNKGNLNKAIRFYEIANDIDPDDRAVYLKLTELYLARSPENLRLRFEAGSLYLDLAEENSTDSNSSLYLSAAERYLTQALPLKKEIPEIERDLTKVQLLLNAGINNDN